MGEAQGDPVHRRQQGLEEDPSTRSSAPRVQEREGPLDRREQGRQHQLQKKSRYRSRYVAEEFNTGDEDGPFASTPPLEALQLIISDVATRDQEEDKVIVVNYVARAFFEAPARRTICVELPKEETHEGDDVGLLFPGPGMRAPTSGRRSGRC